MPSSSERDLFGLHRRAAGTTGSASAAMEDGLPERHRGVGGVGDMARFFKDLGAAPDRGKSFYQSERHRQHLASLVQAGRHAGRSRVQYTGRNIQYHLLTKDFFITMINFKTTDILLIVAAVYLLIFFFFSIWWWLIIRYYPGCVYGATTYVEAFTFAIVTQMTIGYGNTGPQNCWAAAWLIAFQIITALLLESIVIGIVFARISHPKQRSRSIFISDSAVIARRDGILKMMFRVADIRRTQVVDPKIKAFMYTWGEGRLTAEGERIPVRCEALDIGYIDGMLLLPLIIEHTIDERSPLCGHTHDSLLALNAEVVVTFEGTTEFGNPFMTRRSYLPTEIHWGHQFAQIVLKPTGEGEDPKYIIDLNKFHDVLPQDGLPLLAPSQLSQLVVNRAKRTVPYPLLGDNTLVLSDVLCVAPNQEGHPCLIARAADTYPNQMLEITVRMYLYRWRHSGDGPTFTQTSLQCGYRQGTDRLYLRLPVEVCHVIDEKSPIASWLTPGGMKEDSDSEIVVVINGYLHMNGQNRLRQRTYTVHNHVRYGYRFQNIVKHPAESRDRKPRVRWAHFHDVVPLGDAELGDLPARNDVGLLQAASHPNLPAAILNKLPSMAPESHGALRSQEQRRLWKQSSNVVSELESAGLSGGMSVGLSSAQDSGWRRTSTTQAPLTRPVSGHLGAAPAAAAVAATAAAAAATGLAAMTQQQQQQQQAGVPRPSYVPSAEEQRNDYTVLPIDLSRYAATAGNEGDSIPLGAPLAAGRRSPLPSNFAQQLLAARHHQEKVDEEREPFLLFPEVANYAMDTTEADDSLPHPQALHPTLPGPDRFRLEANEDRNDYTVLPMDLSRYMAQIGRSDTMSRRSGPLNLVDTSEVLAAIQRQRDAQQQQQQQVVRPAVAARGSVGRGESSFGGTSGYATPTDQASDMGGSPSPPLGQLLPTDQGSPAATPRLGGPGASAGAAAAAAALEAAAAAGPQQQQEEQQQAQQQEAGQQAEEQEQEEEQALEEQEEDEGEGGNSEASSSIGSDESADSSSPPAESPPAEQRSMQLPVGSEAAQGGGEEEELEGQQLGPEELAQLKKRISRATSSWAMGEQPAESQEEQEGAGPIHFSKQESWQRERALKNLFAGPDSPTAIGADGEGAPPGPGLPSNGSMMFRDPNGGQPSTSRSSSMPKRGSSSPGASSREAAG